MRRLSFLLLVLLATASLYGLPSSAVHAQTVNNCQDYNNLCDEGNAYTVCQAALDYTKSYFQSQGQTPTVEHACTHPTGSAASGYFVCQVFNGINKRTCYQPSTVIAQTWFYHTKLCTQRPSPSSSKQVRNWVSRCVGGCLLEIKNGTSVAFTLNGQTFTEAQGDLVYTGTCPVNSELGESGEDNPETCHPSGSLTVCLKADGEQCIVASTGAKFCYKPGTPSNETAGNHNVATAQTPNQPSAPNSPPQDGTGWQPPATPQPSSTTTPTNGGPIIVTVVNVSTSNGAGSGGGTGGNTGGGTGGNTGGGGGGDPGDPDCDPATEQCDGTASGGEGCEAPPSCSGDQINCAVLTQVWRNRCSPNGNKASGDQCTDQGTVAGFSCSGDEILCKQALTDLERKCRVQSDRSELLRDSAGIDENEPIETPFIDGQAGEGTQFNTGIIAYGGGGDLFPSFSLAGRTFVVPPEVYTILSVIRLLVIAACVLIAMGIVFK